MPYKLTIFNYDAETGLEGTDRWLHTGESLEIWACAYSLTSDRTAMSQKCEPVKGLIICKNYTARFTPYKKNGELSATSVSLHGRRYATNEEACHRLYIHLMEKEVNSLQGIISGIYADQADYIDKKCLENMFRGI